MTASLKRSFAKQLNTWVQTIVIVFAFLWGAYTFIYKEMWLPKAAPVNVTVDLQLKKIGPPNSQLQRGENKALIAVEMTVTATNPSSRQVYLFPSVWTAYGLKVNALRENQEFAKQVTSSLDTGDIRQIEKHAVTSGISTAPVAVGNLFPDNTLKPNEKATRKIVFHVPNGLYDLIQVCAAVATFAKKERADLKWKYNEKTGALDPTIYRVANNGERKEAEKNKDGVYRTDTDLELQQTNCMSTLSLWQ